MNKQELVEKMMTKTKVSLTKADAQRVVAGFINEVVAAVAAGETVQLVGFGTFEARDRAAREARNPLNGQKISIPAKKVPTFKPGKAFKDAVNS